MPNIDKMTEIFNSVVDRFVGAEKNYVGTIAGGGTDYKRNLKIADENGASYRKQFEDAVKETDPEPGA